MKLVEYPDFEMLSIALANTLAGQINNVLFHEECITLGLPGGTTPGPLYDDLSGTTLDWDRVRVIPTDERMVPPDHERSNERLIRERLLTGPAARAHFIPLRPVADGMHGLNDRVGRVLPLTILVLGMGADMHTASLFPNAEDLDAALKGDAPPVMEMTVPGQPDARITLTAPVLKRALNTHVIISGAEKRAALERAAHIDDPLLAPISMVLDNATVHWAR
jgi:6-phosphogluconolactonase